MRFASIRGRAHLKVDDRYVDIAQQSGGRLPADPQTCFDNWDELEAWAATTPWADSDLITAADEEVASPVPRPRQIFAVGLNYAAHAAETGLTGSGETPLTFTKFVSSIAGPNGNLVLPSASVDWEVELVAVIGRYAYRIDESQAWDHIAGLTVGQDFSDRGLQMEGTPPQFSLGKSYPGFAPIGPEVVTADEIVDINDLGLRCIVNGEVVQDGRTSNLIHSVPRLVALYSQICPLLPGDLIFTGTPDGVGMGRNPQRYLQPGDQVVTTVDGIGSMRHNCVAPSDATNIPENGDS